MLSECPFCGSKTGYQTKTIGRLISLYEWDSVSFDTIREWISGGKEKYCVDCGRIVTKYLRMVNND